MKYLAYIALLAGWLIFCLWLYAKEIYPRFHPAEGKSWPVFVDDLKYPVAFRWGSDIPYAGTGFDQWVEGLEKLDSALNIIVFTSHFFRDEKESLEKSKQLASRRIERIIQYLELNRENILLKIIPEDISADMRSNLFEAVRFESFSIHEVVIEKNDTLELCFPVRDSFHLPEYLNKKLDRWLDAKRAQQRSAVIIGTADGTGVSESADMAWERALVVRDRLLQKGWTAETITMSTGQRNLAHTIRNRCVVIFFE